MALEPDGLTPANPIRTPDRPGADAASLDATGRRFDIVLPDLLRAIYAAADGGVTDFVLAAREAERARLLRLGRRRTGPGIGARAIGRGAALYGRLKSALLAYTGDGWLEIENNLAGNALRGIVVGRKNCMFACADCGGKRATALSSLLEAAKLNRVNPQDWPADVLGRVARGQPINRLDESLPWNWAAQTSA